LRKSNGYELKIKLSLWKEYHLELI